MSFCDYYLEESKKDSKKESEAKEYLDKVNKEDEEEVIKKDLGLDKEEEEEVDELTEDYEELTEKKASKKKPIEILTDRYKRKSKLYLISLLINGGKKKKIDVKDVTPRYIHMFNSLYQWNPKMGIFGRWMIRKNRSQYLKKHPLGKEVGKIIRKKRKLMIIKGRPQIKKRIQKGKRIARKKTEGRASEIAKRVK